jgi:hypothetical protein
VPKKVHKAHAPAVVTVHPSLTEEEQQFLSFLDNSSADLSKYSKQLQQQHSHAVKADTAVDVLLSFLKTETPKRGEWTKAALLAAAPTMGLSSRKLRQAFGIAKESEHIEHRADGTVLLL